MEKWISDNLTVVFKDMLLAHELLVTEVGVTKEEAKEGLQNWVDNNFTYQEDFILHQFCEECGWSEDGEVQAGEETGECPDCGSVDIIPETSHEGLHCLVCKHEFDMWEDGYMGDGGIVCEDCLDTLEEKVAEIK